MYCIDKAIVRLGVHGTRGRAASTREDVGERRYPGMWESSYYHAEVPRIQFSS
jgi:hypothetical protein